MARFVETDLSTRVYRITCGLNESLFLAANEPSVGLFRLQEHVVNKVPKQVAESQTLDELSQRVQGACFDLEYDTETVKAMAGITQFSSVLSDLQKAIEIKQQLNKREAESRQQQQHPPPTPSPRGSRGRDYGTLSGRPYPLGGAGRDRNPISVVEQTAATSHIKPKRF